MGYMVEIKRSRGHLGVLVHAYRASLEMMLPMLSGFFFPCPWFRYPCTPSSTLSPTEFDIDTRPLLLIGGEELEDLIGECCMGGLTLLVPLPLFSVGIGAS